MTGGCECNGEVYDHGSLYQIFEGVYDWWLVACQL